ncbi:MFS transporter [Bacteroidia bacterium]|nr:MFS transporter [Bacteroidia bacterium]
MATSLRDSKTARWIALLLLALGMFFSYIFMDILSPIASLVQVEKGWMPEAYGNYQGSETFLNVFVFFLIFAGIILDKMGVRFTAILSGAVMLVGATINWYAVTDMFEASALNDVFTNYLNLPKEAWWNITPWFEGMPASAKFATIGFMIFGCGVEMAGITVSRGIVKWFKGKEMALAMGLEMGLARIGVACVFLLAPAVANFGEVVSISRTVAFGVILLSISLIAFIAYYFMDKKLDVQTGEAEEKDEPFKISDIGLILKSSGFWITALLCVLYYAAIFPFQKYANPMLQANLNFTPEQASLVFFVFPLGAALITPFLGNYLDKKGKGASMLMLGAMLMILCHLTFALILPLEMAAGLKVGIAYAAIVLLGISFSLVPASLWPSVPKLIDNKVLGSAYALIFWIQNIGLYAIPMLIGSVIAKSNVGVENPLDYDYRNPMLIFACFGVLALVLGFVLKAVDKKKGYGLELPNKKS